MAVWMDERESTAPLPHVFVFCTVLVFGSFMSRVEKTISKYQNMKKANGREKAGRRENIYKNINSKKSK